METKVCNKCKEELPKTDEYFYRRSSKSPYFRYTCKRCKASYQKSIKDRHNEHNKKSNRLAKQKVITYYTDGLMCCACCNESHYEFLTIDHINGNGSSHRKELKLNGGHAFYRWLVNNGYPKGYQVLCFNCNCSKGFHGYCPHNKT